MPILLQVESIHRMISQVLEVEIVVDDKVVCELMTDDVDYAEHMIARLMPCIQELMTFLFARACERFC